MSPRDLYDKGTSLIWLLACGRFGNKSLLYDKLVEWSLSFCGDPFLFQNWQSRISLHYHWSIGTKTKWRTPLRRYFSIAFLNENMSGSSNSPKTEAYIQISLKLSPDTHLAKGSSLPFGVMAFRRGDNRRWWHKTNNVSFHLAAANQGFSHITLNWYYVCFLLFEHFLMLIIVIFRDGWRHINTCLAMLMSMFRKHVPGC